MTHSDLLSNLLQKNPPRPTVRSEARAAVRQAGRAHCRGACSPRPRPRASAAMAEPGSLGALGGEQNTRVIPGSLGSD